MGTRADFYIGRGPNAQWLGSIAWDGMPDSIDADVLTATTEESFRDALMAFFGERDDVSGPEHGWPWPWENSRLTDYSYAFDIGKVWTCPFGRYWYAATAADPDPDDSGACDCTDWNCEHKMVFPDMSRFQRVTFGPRSGVIVIPSDG